MNTFEKVYEIVRKVPQGKVTTYGVIAKKIGLSNPRVVGFALHVNKESFNVPCHRVVTKEGRLAPNFAFGGAERQKKILESEGVTFKNDLVDLSKHLFQ